MERRLILMRHASTEAGGPDTSDHQRQLTELGHRQAVEIADRLTELGWTPGHVLSSDAARARQTWEHMAPHIDPPPQVTFHGELYLAGIDAVADCLADLDDEICDLLIIGHNPGWQRALHYLSGDAEVMTEATAGLLHTTADSWPQIIDANKMELVHILRPKTR